MAPIFTKIEIKYHILWAKLDVAGIYYANKRVAIVGTTNFFYPELESLALIPTGAFMGNVVNKIYRMSLLSLPILETLICVFSDFEG